MRTGQASRTRTPTGDEELGALLYELRCNKVLEGEAVAEAIGYTPSYLYAVERGVAMPSIRMLVRLAAFYGCSLEHLAGHLVEAEKETDEE